MKLFAVIAVLGGACGGHGASHGDAASSDSAASDTVSNCVPFSVTASGDHREVQPVRAGTFWAIARPGVYVRIDDDGTVVDTPIADLAASTDGLSSMTMQSLAFDGVELGYFVEHPLPHIVTFSPDDVSTRRESGPFTQSSSGAGPGCVRADPSGAPRIEAFFTDLSAPGRAIHAWSDGTVLAEPHQQAFAVALAPDSREEIYAALISLAQPNPYGFVDGPIASASLMERGSNGSAPVQIVASDRVAIVRNWGTWKVAGQTATPIPNTTPPLAWSGRAFVTFDQGALRLFDADYQPSATRALAVGDTTLLGVGATLHRALLVFAGAGSADVDYVQVCL